MPDLDWSADKAVIAPAEAVDESPVKQALDRCAVSWPFEQQEIR